MTAKAPLPEETRRAWERSEASLSRGVEPPSSGDVVVLERTARFDVEWAVLARDPDRPGKLLAVAADGQPLVGSADVDVPASSPGGPLRLRCRFGCWVEAGLLGPATRTATLARGDVARALERRSDVDRGTVAGSTLADEADDDPEYQDWVRTNLEPAWQTLIEEAREEADEETPALRPRGVADRPTSRRSRGSRRAGSLALAASLLLALGGGLFWRQHREHQREALELRRRSFVINPAVLTLHQDERSLLQEPTEIRLPADASHVVFFVPLLGPRLAPSYRAELLEAATGDRLWASDPLREDLRELRVGLPAALLLPGEYTLRILELRGDETEAMAEFPLRILSE